MEVPFQWKTPDVPASAGAEGQLQQVEVVRLQWQVKVLQEAAEVDQKHRNDLTATLASAEEKLAVLKESTAGVVVEESTAATEAKIIFDLMSVHGNRERDTA